MIHVIPSADRYAADHGWLLSRFSFSFADYYDPSNSSFGTLRVFNDDIIQPGGGFGMHPHRDMEIVTYVIDGTLEHQDSMGNKGIIRPGEVQRMTAGSGLLHSEYNASKEAAVHLLQIWVKPREKGLTPSWEQRQFHVQGHPNQWTPFISGGSIPDTLHIHQDAVFQAAVIEEGQSLHHYLEEGHLGHLFIIEGTAVLNGEYTLHPGDAARIADTNEIHLLAQQKTHVLLIDLAH